ncbi:MAG: PAS domain S-box protein [Steroidobacteraceae bacterium]
MSGEEDDNRKLHTSALKNAESILLVRQRADRELLAAKEALERKTQELAYALTHLREQREWFEVTLASIGDAVITTDTQAKITFLNPVAVALTGWNFEEAVGQPIARVFDIINEHTRKPAPNVIERVLREGIAVNLANHTALIAKDGNETSIEDSAAPIRDSGGRLRGVVMVFRDVAARRRAENELRRSEKQLADFFENAAVGLHWVGPDGIVQRVNQTELDLLGYSKEEFVGRHISEFHADRPVIDDIVNKPNCGEFLQNYEARLLCKDGSIKHVLISSNVLWEDGQFIHTRCFTRDITAQKEAEIALREEIASRERAQIALREADRRKDEFLATLAHELRNPLAPIRQAALISKAPAATEAQKRWSHDVISRQVHHMALLLDDLLDISRITRGMLELRMESTELAAVVDAAVETARPAIDARRHVFSAEIPPKPVYFAADPLRLAQVISNLLTNAAKYTDPEGEIRLRAACAAGTLTITVSDSGIGIPAEDLDDVFSMFSQVKSDQDRSEGGLGIGLALTKGLIELHGGTIQASSAGPGLGSEFVLRLPLRSVSAPRQKKRRAPSGDQLVARRVLIADDNHDAAESLAALLRMEGHVVTVVHDGQEALSAFEIVQPEVALLDIGMPKLNGYEVAREVRRGSLGRAVTLIAITGWGQDNDKAQALAAGFNHHFTKPIEPRSISELLQSDNLRG